MSDRETKSIKFGNHAFVVKTYATAREQNAIQSAYFKGAKVEVVGQQPKISEFDPSVTYNVQLAMIEHLVTEMNGSSENIVERCQELRSSEFDTLVASLDDLVAKKAE